MVQNTFSIIEGRDPNDVYIMEAHWAQDLQITKDLVDDSPYIEYLEIPESRPMIEFTVKNGYARYEVVSYDDLTEIYTGRLLEGKVY
jgi:hypothetical protein